MELKANKLYKIVQRKVFTQEECEKIMSVETEPAPFVTYGHMKKLNLLLQNDDNKSFNQLSESIIQLNKEISKMIDANKKNSNTKILKELTNSTSSLNAALEAISSQNKLLVREITDQKESITFP